LELALGQAKSAMFDAALRQLFSTVAIVRCCERVFPSRICWKPIRGRLKNGHRWRVAIYGLPPRMRCGSKMLSENQKIVQRIAGVKPANALGEQRCDGKNINLGSCCLAK